MKFAHIRVSEYFTFAKQIFHSVAISLARRANFVEKSTCLRKCFFLAGLDGFRTFTKPLAWYDIPTDITIKQNKKDTARVSLLFWLGWMDSDHRKCQSQSLVPYRLATAHYLHSYIITHLCFNCQVFLAFFK